LLLNDIAVTLTKIERRLAEDDGEEEADEGRASARARLRVGSTDRCITVR
jgi:hypothetical protein